MLAVLPPRSSHSPPIGPLENAGRLGCPNVCLNTGFSTALPRRSGMAGGLFQGHKGGICCPMSGLAPPRKHVERFQYGRQYVCIPPFQHGWQGLVLCRFMGTFPIYARPTGLLAAVKWLDCIRPTGLLLGRLHIIVLYIRTVVLVVIRCCIEKQAV